MGWRKITRVKLHLVNQQYIKILSFQLATPVRNVPLNNNKSYKYPGNPETKGNTEINKIIRNGSVDENEKHKIIR